MKTYNITFKGYRRDEKAGTLPNYSGIYMIYRCKYNPKTEKVLLKELFYIGQSKDLNREINQHVRHEEFMSQANEGEEICYAYAQVDNASLDIVENALIYMQQPRLNDNLKESFNHPASEFHFDGCCALLKEVDFSID